MKSKPDRELIPKLLDDFFESAKKGNYTVPNDAIVNDIESIFSCWAKGYREILLVILIARLLDPDYEASKEFYTCNPRPLYEGPIRDALIKYGIPHGLSGPLNVAKATKGINSEWASQRRPKGIAEKAVIIVNWIESLKNNELKNFTVYICSKFLEEASKIKELNMPKDPQVDPIWLSFACKSLIDKTTDRGNTPQRIAGYLLESYHEMMDSKILVSGHEDSASTTNTTSKKPGDLIEVYPDGEILNIYEITVKPFDNQRIKESYSSINNYLDKNTELEPSNIIVICRPQDCLEVLNNNVGIGLYLGMAEYASINYYFINIYEWLLIELIQLGDNGRKLFFTKLDSYISEINTSKKVKILWNSLNV